MGTVSISRLSSVPPWSLNNLFKTNQHKKNNLTNAYRHGVAYHHSNKYKSRNIGSIAAPALYLVTMSCFSVLKFCLRDLFMFLKNLRSTPLLDSCLWAFGFLIPLRWCLRFWL